MYSLAMGLVMHKRMPEAGQYIYIGLKFTRVLNVTHLKEYAMLLEDFCRMLLTLTTSKSTLQSTIFPHPLTPAAIY